MRKIELELDFNKLTDDELEAYLTLKKKGKEQRQAEFLTTSVEVLNAGPRHLHTGVELPHIKLEPVEQPKTILKPKRVSKRYFWSDEMVSMLYDLIEKQKVKISKARIELNKAFGKRINNEQVYKKVYNIKYRNNWNDKLLISPSKSLDKDEVKSKLEELGIEVTEPKTSKKMYSKRNSPETFKAIVDMMQDEKMSFGTAFLKIVGKETSGVDYKKYKEFCEKQNITPAVRPKVYSKRKKEKRVPRPNPYIDLRSKHFQKVIATHGLDSMQATKYIAKYWSESGKDFDKADELITQTYNLPFAYLSTISPEVKPILKDMLNNMIVNRTTLDLKDGFTMGLTKSKWKDFCYEFLDNSQKIAEELKVENKFKINKTAFGYLVIQFE